MSTPSKIVAVGIFAGMIGDAAASESLSPETREVLRCLLLYVVSGGALSSLKEHLAPAWKKAGLLGSWLTALRGGCAIPATWTAAGFVGALVAAPLWWLQLLLWPPFAILAPASWARFLLEAKEDPK